MACLSFKSRNIDECVRTFDMARKGCCIRHIGRQKCSGGTGRGQGLKNLTLKQWILRALGRNCPYPVPGDAA